MVIKTKCYYTALIPMIIFYLVMSGVTGCSNEQSKKSKKDLIDTSMRELLDSSDKTIKDKKEEKIFREKSYVDTFKLIENTQISNLEDKWKEIIDKRKICYSENFSLESRLGECRHDYILEIVLNARQNIKAVPMLGNFVLCTEECPIYQALCRGSAKNDEERENCESIEIRCIEHCLDEYWRGGQPPKDTRFQ